MHPQLRAEVPRGGSSNSNHTPAGPPSPLLSSGRGPGTHKASSPWSLTTGTQEVGGAWPSRAGEQVASVGYHVKLKGVK